MRRVALLAILGTLALVARTLAADDGALPLRLRDGHGIRIDSARRLDARQLDLRVATDALQLPVDVRVLLPTGYDATPDRRYPVLYLFHGTSGRAADWVDFGNAVETTAGLPMIVVMPDAGFNGDGGGWFANWFNGGVGGQPMWETFHVDQVIPWVDANLRTIPTRAGRAIAGLSQGGFGALSYAARHPDLFTSVASFSGGCVIDRDPRAIAVATGIIEYTTSGLSGVADPDAIFGPRATQELNWQAHDPGTLVTNLRGMQIALWTGNGDPGPLDPGPNPAASAIEVITFGATQLFDGYLTEAGIRHAYHYYGAGTHTFGYWARDLEEYVGPLMRRFRNPPPRSRSISYLSADDHWRHWGWEVTLHRTEPVFAQLRRAGRTGFALSGTGRARVRTPAVYRAGAQMRVTERGPAGTSSRETTVDPVGRLRLVVPLGADATPATTRVSIQQVQ